MRDLLAAASEGVLRVADDSTIRESNPAAASLLGTTPDALVGTPLVEAFPDAIDSRAAEAFRGERPPAEEVSFEEYYPPLSAWLSVRAVPIDDGLAVYLRDASDRRRRERALDARRDELETLDRINRIVGELVGSLVERTDRGGIEATVCERLAASSLFEFAWIAEGTLDGGLRASAVAGPSEGVVDELTATATDPEPTAAGPSAAPTPRDLDDGPEGEPGEPGEPGSGGDAARDTDGGADAGVDTDTDASADADGDTSVGLERAALASGEVRVARELVTDRSVPERVRRAAFERGLQSGLAVPLSYGDTVYGVLGVYTARPEAFGERQRTGFRTLGDAVGVAINAAKQRRLLLSDTVVELTLELSAADSPLATVSRELGCSLVGAGIVPVDEASVIQFLVVEDAPPDAVLDALHGVDGLAVTAERVVDDGEGADGEGGDGSTGRRDGDGSETNEGDGGNADGEGTDAGGTAGEENLIVVRLSGESPLLTLIGYGATVGEVAYADGAGRVRASVPPDEAADVLRALRDAFPGTTLRRKRERERDVTTLAGFRRTARDRLTDRQLEALRTAFLAGYFEWPRRSTAEEVAETMEISSPTLHSHLRKSLRELLTVFFERQDAAGVRGTFDEQPLDG
jgi:hypothetical protein